MEGKKGQGVQLAFESRSGMWVEPALMDMFDQSRNFCWTTLKQTWQEEPEKNVAPEFDEF